MTRRRGKGKKREPAPQPSQHPTKQDRKLVRAEFAASFTGPLPPPQLLAQYNEAVPSGAERIMMMAESQAEHRQGLESRVIFHDIIAGYLGIVAGLCIAVAFLVAAYLLIDAGHEAAGVTLGTLDLVGLVGVFVYGTRSRRAERELKSRIMSGQPTD